MENREQQILSEIKSMMASIRSQLELLDAKMAELQQAVDPEEFESESVDLDIDVDIMQEETPFEEVTVQELPMEETVGEEEAVEEIPDDDLPFDEVPEVSETEVTETEDADIPESDDLPEVPESDDLPEVREPEMSEPEPAEDDDLPGIFDEPEVVPAAPKTKAAAKPTVNDMMASDYAWRRDMPGARVRDVRSAISLNDRVIFINLLFEEDAQVFVNTLTRINSMENLDQAVELISAEFPSWDMSSDLVSRFMMAVRRKLQ